MLNDVWKGEVGGNPSNNVTNVADVATPIERAESFYNTNSEFDTGTRTSRLPPEDEEDESKSEKTEGNSTNPSEGKKEVEEGFYAT